MSLHSFVIEFWPSTVDGLVLGSIYALIALGYTMVYGVLKLINFAHSEVFMVGTMAVLGPAHPPRRAQHPAGGRVSSACCSSARWSP